MYFRQLPHADSGAYCYLLADLDAQEALVIDPDPDQVDLLLAMLQERDLRLMYVLRTHLHGRAEPCGALCEYTGATRIAGAASTDTRARTVAHGDTLIFGGEVIRVLSTPGHTPDAVSYLWRDRLFSGDALHPAGCPAPLDTTDPGQWYDSVTQRLFLLPDETLVFPGHVQAGRTVSTIAEERRRNPAFGGISREGFINQTLRRPQGECHATEH